MQLTRLTAPLLLAVGSYGLNLCFTDDDACSSGLTTLEFDQCDLHDEELSELAACFDSVGRATIKSVTLSSNELTSLPPDIFDGLEALTTLDVSHNDFVHIQAGNFKGISALESLDLGRNSIKTVAVDAFEDLPALKSLSLYKNDIYGLEAGTFSGAPALEYLDLGHNYLNVTFPAGVFDGTGENLTTLSITDTELVTLPAGIFDGMVNLEKLTLGAGEIAELPANIFDDLVKLDYLNLQSNELSELPTGTFKNLASLKTLFLRSNNFVTLPAGFLEGLVSLNKLTMTNTDLTSLPEDFCQSTPSLDELTLDSSDISTLLSGTFDGCGNLTHLSMGHNELTTLPDDIFRDLASLDELHIFWTQLSTLPAAIFQGTPALTRLYLYKNELTTLPPGIFDATPALETVWLRLNVGMTVSAGLFDGLTSLTYLDLAANMHDSLPTDAFDSLVGLETLFLNSNNLTTLPAGLFDGPQALETLWLTTNEYLQCVPETDAEKVIVTDDDVEESGICECPQEPTCDENGEACDCQPGADGYSCATTSSSEVVRAFSCSPAVPSTATPAPTTGSLVDAAERTTVVVEASGFDERTTGYGCSPAGCTAGNTRDGSLDANSRWSCKGDLLAGDGELCCIEYSFEDPQDIVTIQLAFYKGTESTRTLNVYDNDELHSQIQSSGSSVGYQEFALNTGGTADLMLCVDDSESSGDDWLSITEVQIMVK